MPFRVRCSAVSHHNSLSSRVSEKLRPSRRYTPGLPCVLDTASPRRGMPAANADAEADDTEAAA